MRNPWNDDFVRASSPCRHCKPGFSMRTAVMIAVGNAAMMTAAHALAGGFGRAFCATRDTDTHVVSEPRKLDGDLAPREPEPIQPRFEPSWNWPLPPPESVPVQIVAFELVPVWFETRDSHGASPRHAVAQRYSSTGH